MGTPVIALAQDEGHTSTQSSMEEHPMYGCTRKWLVGMLALGLFSSGSAIAWGQDGLPTYSPYDLHSRQVVQASAYVDDATLADRVGELEASIKSLNDKAAAAKKKAAGKPSVTMGGRIMADWTAYSQDAASMAQITDQQNGFEFRRARLFAKGTAFNVVDYKAQYDFASGGTNRPAFKDMYITVKELPLLGHCKVGHFKEPFGLEELTSSKYITFMERSLTSPFTPGRNVGIAAYDCTENENATWAVGVFINETPETPPTYRNDTNDAAFTGRVTWLPWYDEATNGRGLLHVGASGSYRNVGDGTLQFRDRPEAHLGSRIVDTGTFVEVRSEDRIGLEAALVYGPLSVQGEYMRNRCVRSGFANPEFEAAYGMVSYFLTGENRVYKRTAGCFSRVKPFENFFRVRTQDGDVQMGKGAWELAYRISYIDLNSAGITGGNATDHTLGVNWYLNPYTRVMLNYVNSDLRRFGTTGNMNIVETRAQIDW